MQNILKKINQRTYSKINKPSLWTKIKHKILNKKQNTAYYLSQQQKEIEYEFKKKLKENFSKKFFLEKDKKEKFVEDIQSLFFKIQNNFESLDISEKESKWILNAFLESDHVRNSIDLQISLLWVLLKKYPEKIIENYLSIFMNLFQEQDFRWDQINRLLQIIHKQKTLNQKSELIQKNTQSLLKILEKQILTKLQQDSQETTEIVVTAQLLRKMNFQDDQLFYILNEQIQKNIEPFNSEKNLIILKYFNELNQDLESIKLKSSLFDKTSALLIKNMRHCYFDQLYEYLILFVQFQKQYGQKFTVVYDSFVKRLFIIQNLSETLNTQKLTNLLYLLKNQISKEQYRTLLEKIQHVVYHNLQNLKANDYADFLYVCFQENYIEDDYLKQFQNHALKYVYQYDLKQLLKVAWTNDSLLNSELLDKKILEILEQLLQKQIAMKQKKLDTKFIFPFIYIYSVKLPKKLTDLYDKYIEKYYQEFDLQDISIILWSTVRKINIKKKILSILLLRTFQIIRPVQQQIAENQDYTQWEIEVITKIPFQDLMIILKSLDYFDFKDNGIILSDMLFLVKNFIIFYEEEICTDDLFNILRVYFKDTPSFKELLHQSKSFYDYLFLFIDKCKNVLKIQDLNIIIFFIVENKLLTDTYAQQVQELINYRNSLIKNN